MSSASLSRFLKTLTRGMAAATLTERSDPELAERFVTEHGEAAFEALVRRHGPMVYRVCWRVLQQTQDVEDAFQATFLLLARKLSTIRKQQSLASWLHGVAHRVALKAKAQAAVRRRQERQVSRRLAVMLDEVTWGELRSVLDQELTELPEKWRLPLILCYLEAHTQDEAAAHLGWSKITLRRRLAEARAALGRRLRRRGLAPTAALGGLLVSESVASAVVPGPLVTATVTAGSALLARGSFGAGGLPVSVLALMQGVLKTMLVTKLQSVLVIFLGVALLGGGAFLVASPQLLAQRNDEPAPRQAAPAPPGPVARALTPEEEYQAILKAYDEAAQAFRKALESAQSPEERGELMQSKYLDLRMYAKRLLALARRSAENPVAVDALAWICTYLPQTTGGPDPKKSGEAMPEARAALELLHRKYLHSDKLVAVCHMGRHYQNLRNPLMETFLHDLLAHNPHPAVQAQACLSLALVARERSRAAAEIQRLGKDSDYFRRLEQFYEPDQLERLAKGNPRELEQEAEKLLERLGKEFGTLPVYGEKGTFGEKAAALLAEMRELVVGKPAPEIDAEAIDGARFKLSDYRGRVVVLVFWGTWCAPCMKQVPQERALVDKYKDQPFALLGVNNDEDRHKLPDALKKHGITWRSWWDGREGPIARHWGITGWPTVYVLDGQGVIRYKNVRAQELDQAVEQLLKEKTASPQP